MLRCPENHAASFLVMSTGEMLGRMVRSGILGCPLCRNEYPIVKGVVKFSGGETRVTRDVAEDSPPFPVDAPTLQALLDLSGPGGYVVLVGSAVRHAEGLAGLMGGIHFVGINAPSELEELPVLSLLECATLIPLRDSVARAVVVGAEAATAPWLAEARRVLLRGRRVVAEREDVTPPESVNRLASGQGLWVGERA